MLVYQIVIILFKIKKILLCVKVIQININVKQQSLFIFRYIYF